MSAFRDTARRETAPPQDAARDRAINVDIDLSSIPFAEELRRGGGAGRRGGRRMTGWI